MCGRYLFLDGKHERLAKLAELAKAKMPEAKYEEISLFEVFPSANAFVSFQDPDDQKLKTMVMRWGYLKKGSGSGLVINARSETCFSSLFFRGSIPVAVPCSAYYEWSKNPRIKYAFSIEGDMYLGAIARIEEGEWHFVILTENAGMPQYLIHDRQPLVFSYADAKKWSSSKNPTQLYSLSIQKRFSRKV